MIYPYTNEEIQEISDGVANELSGYIKADNINNEFDYSNAWRFISGWNN